MEKEVKKNTPPSNTVLVVHFNQILTEKQQKRFLMENGLQIKSEYRSGYGYMVYVPNQHVCQISNILSQLPEVKSADYSYWTSNGD